MHSDRILAYSGRIPTKGTGQNRMGPEQAPEFAVNTIFDIPVYSGWYLSTMFLQVENACNYYLRYYGLDINCRLEVWYLTLT